MANEEKLRSLLAEARGWLGPGCGASNCTEGCCALRVRIDAALAEPVEGCARCETLRELADTAAAEQGLAQRRMLEAQKQRDEARAEVERLQAELVRVARAEFDRGAKQGVEQALWASRTAQETAYQRGAEAMREAAMGAAWHSAAMGLHKRIKEMPIPEDRE